MQERRPESSGCRSATRWRNASLPSPLKSRYSDACPKLGQGGEGLRLIIVGLGGDCLFFFQNRGAGKRLAVDRSTDFFTAIDHAKQVFCEATVWVIAYFLFSNHRPVRVR